MRGMRRRFAPDDGMTLVEVVIASAILFFIMTAVLGLVGRSTLMSVQAKQMNAVNNAINSYVEWARVLPFAELDSLEATTVAAGEYTVSIVPQAELTENQYLKDLWLGVTVTAPNGFIRVVNTMVIIHDRTQYMTQAEQSAQTDPTIVILAASPPNGTPVWVDGSASYWKDASGVTRPVTLSARAMATEGRTVEEVFFTANTDTTILEDVFGNTAEWLEPTWTNSPVFSVDLKQADGTVFVEGERTVYAFVRDSAGVIRQATRTWVVDNLAPEKPPWPVQLDDRGTGARLIFWPMVMDGTHPAYRYVVSARKQPLEPVTSWTEWTVAVSYTGSATGVLLDGTPMSRYLSLGRALSPRGLTTANGPTAYLVTRPLLSGTYAVVRRGSTPKGWDVTPTLTATPPSFESTGTTTYAWYANDVLIGTTTEDTFLAPKVSVEGDPTAANFPVRTYTVAVTAKPLGYPSFANNPPVSRTSNAVTTVAPAASGTYTFTEGTW